MKFLLCLLCPVVLPGCASLSGPPLSQRIQVITTASPTETNSSCDSAGFLKAAEEAERLRVKRRLPAAAFARMAKEPGTIVLDARSKESHAALRIKGSLNLPYTEMAEETLRSAIPNENTRILIYCRNNIFDIRPLSSAGRAIAAGVPYPDEFDPPQIPKMRSAGLNIPTYITLHIYGYNNVWELDPAVDPNHSAIEFESGPLSKR